jgi:hypothetical protein
LAGLYLLLTAGFSPRFRILDSIWGPKNARECPPRIIRRSRLLHPLLTHVQWWQAFYHFCIIR